jgi:DNA-binding MarR family transcriptional regulator
MTSLSTHETLPDTPAVRRSSSADDPTLDVWRAFIQTHARLIHKLDEELQAAHGLSLAEYDALLQLVNAPDRRLRMSALADRVLLSRSGITRLVDRLEAAGMVERTACATDARGSMAAITHLGVTRLRAASKTHLEGVRRYFLDVIAADDQAVMQRSLERVANGLTGRDITAGSVCSSTVEA